MSVVSICKTVSQEEMAQKSTFSPNMHHHNPFQGSWTLFHILGVGEHLNDEFQLKRLALHFGVDFHKVVGFIKESKSTAKAALEVLEIFWDQEGNQEFAVQKLGAALTKCKLKDVAQEVLAYI